MPPLGPDVVEPFPASSTVPAENGRESWLHGFHGALVHIEDIPPLALRRLAMSRQSTGLGRIGSLVELPGPPRTRLPPRASVGARRAVHEDAGTGVRVVVEHPPEGPPPAPTRRVDLPGHHGPARSAQPPDGGAPAADESLPAFLDRRLADARFLLLPNRSRAYAVSKRVLDVGVALVLLVLTFPVLIALAVLIRLDSPGPAVFRQVRVTRGGRTFRFYKFRTMYVDARERHPALYDYRVDRDQFETAYYKLADDPRNTRVGRWLRRTTLDELPNLFNVLIGDISLVGPRPDLPEFVRLYRPEELCCLFTKAGLTGVAQVSGRSLLTVRERLTLDMRYVAHQTLVLDLRILWRTLLVVCCGRGAF